MAVARRLYLYAIAGITLALLVGALITLINLALEIAFGPSDPLFGNPQTLVRGQLSLVLATIAVALPVWALHWAIAERSLGSAAGVTERRSAVRALYLTLILLGLLVVLIASGTQIVRYVLVLLVGGSALGTTETLSPIGAVLVASVFWAYHAWVRLRDLRTEMSGAAAWLPRAYRYLAMLIGLFTMLAGIVQLIGLAGDALELGTVGTLARSGAGGSALAGTLTPIVVGLVLWLSHWAYSVRLLEARDWRGAAERTSKTRGGYLVVVIVVGAGWFIFQLSTALATIFQLALNSNEVTAGDALRTTAGSVVIGLVFAGVWWAHRLALIGERRVLGPAAQQSARRLDAYAVLLLALASGASALAWLVGLALDVVGRGGRTLGGAATWQLELTAFLSYAVVASVVWLLNLRQVQRWRSADEQAEARSTARRAYLLLAIAGALLGAVSALVLILNRLIGSLIGASASRSLASELSTPVGVVIVAALVVVLHFWWLRRDQRIHAAQAEAPTGASPEPQAPEPAATARVQLLALTVPPDGDVGDAVSHLRAALPEGYLLDEAG